jgi:hypothetical protein
VTSWQDLGYLQLIQQSPQGARPQEPVYKLPINDIWLRPSHLFETLSKAGFQQVNIPIPTVYYAGENASGVATSLETLFGYLVGHWKENDQSKFKQTLEALTQPAVETFKKADGSPAVGIPMIASVAVRKK